MSHEKNVSNIKHTLIDSAVLEQACLETHAQLDLFKQELENIHRVNAEDCLIMSHTACILAIIAFNIFFGDYQDLQGAVYICAVTVPLIDHTVM